MVSRLPVLTIFCVLIAIALAGKPGGRSTDKPAGKSVKSADAKGAKGAAKQLKSSKSSASSNCDTASLKAIEGCCRDIPRVLDPASFPPCYDTYLSVRRQYELQEKKTNAPGVPPSGRGGGLCLMECVLQRQDLLLAPGKPNVEKIFDGLMKNATTDAWRSVVKKTIDGCKAEIAGADMGALTPNVENVKICSPVCGMTMACIRRRLALDCPNYNETPECKANKDKLSNCNPLDVMQIAAQKGASSRGKKALKKKQN